MIFPPYYTIPRNNRELQYIDIFRIRETYYTIPRNNRELQQGGINATDSKIIPYQEIIGNYSRSTATCSLLDIIPYQEIIGNYSPMQPHDISQAIIPYQEIIGNYSLLSFL